MDLVSSAREYNVSEIEEEDNTMVHSVMTELSPVKPSKNQSSIKR